MNLQQLLNPPTDKHDITPQERQMNIQIMNQKYATHRQGLMSGPSASELERKSFYYSKSKAEYETMIRIKIQRIEKGVSYLDHINAAARPGY
ncbi:unnamed protein product [Ambrosiozyma monospora]|uniref:Unnamed protein product n=2 Tax=Ambrosiozyma monospora TaxID=43982 RepID=A0ACB5SRV2_AMBMO|nr:unnamed protein product [Ambrosiozyma monospora]GMG37679.1 unnamed protein product [Ambrosiozyma monospora]